jgi:hypothetical protein
VVGGKNQKKVKILFGWTEVNRKREKYRVAVSEKVPVSTWERMSQDS